VEKHTIFDAEHEERSKGRKRKIREGTHLVLAGVKGERDGVASRGEADVERAAVLDLVASGVVQECEDLTRASLVVHLVQGNNRDRVAELHLLGGRGPAGDAEALALAVDSGAHLDELALHRMRLKHD
jgi:hypothetical protein